LNLLKQLQQNVSPGPMYEQDVPGVHAPPASPVRLVAFYLPQFHPIPENDEWWGKGFTEWANVTRAYPRFVGHYQPRLPSALGFYDLRHVETIRKQADLARRYGIYGFCFHHYWFNGRRILDTPLNLLLANHDIDLPFCINWANENWTRRWDGHDQEVLLAQQHSPEDDLAFAKAAEPILRDRRYIRIDGRPLLMLYRPGILPDAAATLRCWRSFFTDAGIGNPYLVMAQAFGDGDPQKYGFDAVVGFPPFWTAYEVPWQHVKVFDRSFKGAVIAYEDMAAATLTNYRDSVRLFPGVCPSWDNEARRPGRGFSFVESTPAKYGAWLMQACKASMQMHQGDSRLVFINAWNEWAEGAYLEPDRHFGFAYLAETARVLRMVSGSQLDRSLAFERKRRGSRLRLRLINKAALMLDQAADAVRGW
jgi:lipopolysaccharide biosynthesis protein